MLTPRKKVLVITYYWPPAGGAGVQRWLKFVKYFRDFGWEPIVYTPENPEMPARDESLLADVPADIQMLKTPIWEPYDAYKKLVGRKKEEGIGAGFVSDKKQPGKAESLAVWVRGNFFIPDARRFWIRPSVKFLAQWLSENKVDAIVSTGPPHSMHLIALGLKKKMPHLKWVADFRDPWTNIDFYEELKLSSWADAKHHRLERKVLQTANAVVSVGKTMSDEFGEILAQAHTSNRLEVIPNGFDPDAVFTSGYTPDEKFSIAHIGTLNRSRNPHELWNVLSMLVKENEAFATHLEIKLVGKVDFQVMEAIEQAGLTKYLRKIDYVPLSEVGRVQKESRVLLLLINRTKNAKGIITGKFFEYMATGNPVLAIGPEDGDAAAIIAETGCGFISGFGQTENLTQHILQLFQQYKSGHTPHQISPLVQQYSRRELTGKMARLLESL
ncbi:MAG: glycosyltransferase family 4 protein [Bacteroidetes bacterium]|nr:glycosyltransferase family 4 protein [Bacteroidota bacterium]